MYRYCTGSQERRTGLPGVGCFLCLEHAKQQNDSEHYWHDEGGSMVVRTVRCAARAAQCALFFQILRVCSATRSRRLGFGFLRREIVIRSSGELARRTEDCAYHYGGIRRPQAVREESARCVKRMSLREQHLSLPLARVYTPPLNLLNSRKFHSWQTTLVFPGRALITRWAAAAGGPAALPALLCVPLPWKRGKSAHEQALPALLRVYPPEEFAEFAEVFPEEGGAWLGARQPQPMRLPCCFRVPNPGGRRPRHLGHYFFSVGMMPALTARLAPRYSLARASISSFLMPEKSVMKLRAQSRRSGCSWAQRSTFMDQ